VFAPGPRNPPGIFREPKGVDIQASEINAAFVASRRNDTPLLFFIL